jgi:hypothetical protein
LNNPTIQWKCLHCSDESLGEIERGSDRIETLVIETDNLLIEIDGSAVVTHKKCGRSRRYVPGQRYIDGLIADRQSRRKQ